MQIFSQIPVDILAGIIFAVIFLIVAIVKGPSEKRKIDRLTADEYAYLDEDVTVAEIKDFEAWFAEKQLPYAGLVVVDEVPADHLSSHIGGVAVAPKGAVWPDDKTGNPMVLLAQVNLSDVSTPQEFPNEGILQFFIKSDDLFGLNFEDQLDSDYKVLWYPDIVALTEILCPEHDFKNDYAPFNNANIWERGRILKTGRVGNMRPSWGNWYFEEKVELICEKRIGIQVVDEIVDGWGAHGHFMGGHARFTQVDPRSKDKFQDYNRVLLQISCDDFIMFGDSGECTFFITEEDLETKRFDRLLYNWDCC